MVSSNIRGQVQNKLYILRVDNTHRIAATDINSLLATVSHHFDVDQDILMLLRNGAVVWYTECKVSSPQIDIMVGEGYMLKITSVGMLS